MKHSMEANLPSVPMSPLFSGILNFWRSSGAGSTNLKGRKQSVVRFQLETYRSTLAAYFS